MTEFNSSLQVFKQMESMSSELSDLRSSEGKLRRERRAIIQRLQQVARTMDDPDQQDEVLDGLVKRPVLLNHRLQRGSTQLESAIEQVAELEKVLHNTAPGHATQVLASPRLHHKPPAKTVEEGLLCSPRGHYKPQGASREEGAPLCSPRTHHKPRGRLASVGEDSPVEEAPQDEGVAAAVEAATDPASLAEAWVPPLARRGPEEFTIGTLEDDFEAEGPPLRRSTSNLSMFSMFSGASTTSAARFWSADKPSCEVCGKGFAMWRRRHHCRSCGCCCCDECSPYRVRLVEPVRRPAKKGAAGPVLGEEAVSTCPAEHLLMEFETDKHGYSCSACAKKVPKGATLWGCRQCDFDLCGACRQGDQEESVPDPAPMSARGQAERVCVDCMHPPAADPDLDLGALDGLD